MTITQEWRELYSRAFSGVLIFPCLSLRQLSTRDQLANQNLGRGFPMWISLGFILTVSG